MLDLMAEATNKDEIVAAYEKAKDRISPFHAHAFYNTHLKKLDGKVNIFHILNFDAFLTMDAVKASPMVNLYSPDGRIKFTDFPVTVWSAAAIDTMYWNYQKLISDSLTDGELQPFVKTIHDLQNKGIL